MLANVECLPAVHGIQRTTHDLHPKKAKLKQRTRFVGDLKKAEVSSCAEHIRTGVRRRSLLASHGRRTGWYGARRVGYRLHLVDVSLDPACQLAHLAAQIGRARSARTPHGAGLKHVSDASRCRAPRTRAASRSASSVRCPGHVASVRRSGSGRFPALHRIDLFDRPTRSPRRRGRALTSAPAARSSGPTQAGGAAGAGDQCRQQQLLNHGGRLRSQNQPRTVMVSLSADF
jgi:hypothetical protein